MLTPTVSPTPQLSTVSPSPQLSLRKDARNNVRTEAVLIYCINIRCLLKYLAELKFHLEAYKAPIVFIQETWLNQSVESVSIQNYRTISRRGRHAGDNRGGILTLARDGFNQIGHIRNSVYSVFEERSWHFLNLGPEVILLGNWYRPGATPHDGFSELYADLNEFASEITGVILSGDMNVHHLRWLRHSSGNTPVGSDLKGLCDSYGLTQLVKQPTRNEYLLDLFLTDLPDCDVKVLPTIADHNATLASVPLPAVTCKTIVRQGWILQLAKWQDLQTSLRDFQWTELRKGSAEDALNYFLDILWMQLRKFIPFRTIREKKQSHPWLNSRCEEAITRKNAAQGRDSYAEAQQHCSQVLAEEYQIHVEALRVKMAALSRSDKRWWKLNRELLHKRAKVTSISPLRDEAVWVTDSKQKANLFAKTFALKAKLPEEEIDCPFFGHCETELDGFLCIRTRTTLKILRKLDESTATGNDRIPAKILKGIASEIAAPFSQVCRRLFDEGCWPQRWRLHLICPIYKKDSAFKPGNYRGVHLTTILSKVAERVIGNCLVKFLQQGKFGENQWAFTTGRSARDLVTVLMMKWILAICTGSKIGGFLSDISGAFDRVFKPIILGKLRAAGVGEDS